MKKFKFGIIIAVLSVLQFSCKNGGNTTVVDEQEGGIQIDSDLKELGELNVKLLDYDELEVPRNGVVPVKKKGKWGLVAKDGREILPCSFKDICYGENEDVWIVKRNDSIGIVDNKGTFISALTNGFKSYTCLGNGLIHVVCDDALTTQHVVKIQNFNERVSALLSDVKSVTSFTDNVLLAEWFGNYKLYSYVGDSLVAISSDYQHYTGESGEGMYCVANGWSNEKYGYINTKGEIAIPFEFDNPCGVFSDGMATYKDSTDFVGYIDRTGKIIIPAQYVDALDFSDGLAYVANEEMAGFIDKAGKVVIDTKWKYSCGGGFNKGFCIIFDSESDNNGIINKKGDMVVPPNYIIHSLSDDVYVASEADESSKYGAFSYDGKQIIPFEYDDMTDFHEGLALAKLGDRWFVINKEGKTGIVNFEEALAIHNEKVQQAKQEGQADLEENIKKQIVELINEDNGWKVLSGPSSVRNLQKVSEGMYKAEFIQETQYEYMDYEIRNIEVDENGNVLGLQPKRVNIRPKANKPDGGIKSVDEIVDQMTGRNRY